MRTLSAVSVSLLALFCALPAAAKDYTVSSGCPSVRMPGSLTPKG